VYEESHSRQFVLSDDGKGVHGVWCFHPTSHRPRRYARERKLDIYFVADRSQEILDKVSANAMFAGRGGSPRRSCRGNGPLRFDLSVRAFVTRARRCCLTRQFLSVAVKLRAGFRRCLTFIYG
jgi:hypothetical protein